MKLEYSLNKEDFLQYQLFTASKSKNIIKQKKRTFIWVIVFLIVSGFNIYNRFENWLIYFIPLCFIIFLLSYYSVQYQYKSHYSKFIKENYKEKIGLVSSLNFKNEELMITNSIAESKISYNSFLEIIEIQDYYYLKLKTEESFIIPKNIIIDKQEFEQVLLILKEKYNVKEIIDLKWKY